MARSQIIVPIAAEQTLAPMPFCWVCQRRTLVAYHSERWIVHLRGVCHYTMVVRRCVNRACIRYRICIRPEAEGGLALSNGKFGLDVIALVGHLRCTDQLSMRAIHRGLVERGVGVAERTVTGLAHRHAELLALAAAGPARLAYRPGSQDRVILAMDGVQLERGEAVLWIVRDVLSGTVLLVRSLRKARGADLGALIGEVSAIAPLPIMAVLCSGPDGRCGAPGVALSAGSGAWVRD